MISVCLPTYNGEKYILQQIESILIQLSDIDELILSDDGSTDNTCNIIKAIKDIRINLITNPTNGVISNVENALMNAKGDFIFLSDQDDIWLPNKVSVSLTALTNSDLIISDCYITDKDLNIIGESFFKRNNSKRNKWKALIRNSYLGCCMAFNRSVLNDALPFPTDIPMHDIWIGNVAAFRHKVSFIDDKLIYYRRHGYNASTAAEPSNANILSQIKFRTTLFIGLIKLFIK
ncbi:MAG: glycosyltransferase family 2 protein [Paludibacter sp.]|nr:glycosyltransferase family 2 protein [Paludibacter sp.]